LYDKVQTVKALLDAGFIVISPNAHSSRGYWDTNASPYNTGDLSRWDSAPDHQIADGIHKGIRSGTFGNANPLLMHALGFSSGGYMTSRMAFSYAGTYKSLSIVCGSYYWCSGDNCPSTPLNSLQPELSNHPPTLFLHGSRDSTVPASTSVAYYNTLRANNIDTKMVTQNVGHVWPSNSPSQIVAWVLSHNVLPMNLEVHN
jgi:predicted esterase